MDKLIYNQTYNAVKEIAEKANLKKGSTLVVGCSTSEIAGSKIGTNSDPNLALYVFNALNDYTKQKGIYLAIQCCEHLNRAIIIEKDGAKNYEIVNVVPQPKAGGSFATAACTSRKGGGLVHRGSDTCSQKKGDNVEGFATGF